MKMLLIFSGRVTNHVRQKAEKLLLVHILEDILVNGHYRIFSTNLCMLWNWLSQKRRFSFGCNKYICVGKYKKRDDKNIKIRNQLAIESLLGLRMAIFGKQTID